MATNDGYKQFTDIRYGIDKNNRLFFYGVRLDDNRTVRISMRNALYNGTPTEDGIELSPGFIIPYGEFNPFKVARKLYGGGKLTKLAAEEEYVSTWVIFSNSYFKREWFDEYPSPPYSKVSQYGVTIEWHIKGKRHVYIHDYREPFGQNPKLDAAFERFMKIFSYEIYGRSDQVVYVQGELGLMDTMAKTSNDNFATTEDKVVIDNIRYFKDTLIETYPKRRWEK